MKNKANIILTNYPFDMNNIIKSNIDGYLNVLKYRRSYFTVKENVVDYIF